jgi:hypothetical protein
MVSSGTEPRPGGEKPAADRLSISYRQLMEWCFLFYLATLYYLNSVERKIIEKVDVGRIWKLL